MTQTNAGSEAAHSSLNANPYRQSFRGEDHCRGEWS